MRQFEVESRARAVRWSAPLLSKEPKSDPRWFSPGSERSSIGSGRNLRQSIFKLAHARPQRVRIDPEQRRRAVPSLDASVCLAQSPLDVTLHHDVQGFNRNGLGGRNGRRRARCPWALPQGGDDVEDPPLPDQHGTVDHGRDLAHLAWPSILGEQSDVLV